MQYEGAWFYKLYNIDYFMYYMHSCAFLIGLQLTPLHWAAVKNHAEMISRLIDAGAQLEAKDGADVSAWFVMVECTMHVHLEETDPISR